jgi:hypothetical protein
MKSNVFVLVGICTLRREFHIVTSDGAIPYEFRFEEERRERTASSAHSTGSAGG